jgi:hypothetical protein
VPRLACRPDRQIVAVGPADPRCPRARPVRRSRHEHPIEGGGLTARQVPLAIFAVVTDAGITPDGEPCGAKMARQFIAILRTNPHSYQHAAEPPPVAVRPALRAADLPQVGWVHQPPGIGRSPLRWRPWPTDTGASEIAQVPVPVHALRAAPTCPPRMAFASSERCRDGRGRFRHLDRRLARHYPPAANERSCRCALPVYAPLDANEHSDHRNVGKRRVALRIPTV